MGETTAIAWTDHTFNPWWGCTNVSPGCDHCYAETFAKRTGHDVWGKGGERRLFGDKHWAEPVKWNRQAETEGVRHRVFCASMADVFEVHPELPAQRTRLFELIEQTPYLDWQLLTKRPENVPLMAAVWMDAWPDHVWIGTTVEDQTRANIRIPRLLKVPARIRFLSCEPLLGPVDLGIDDPHADHETDDVNGHPHPLVCMTCSDPDADRWVEYFRREHGGLGISWVIVGGESGPGHRALNLDHARSLRDQCRSAEVPFFFKQVGGHHPTTGGDQLDGETIKEFPAWR